MLVVKKISNGRFKTKADDASFKSNQSENKALNI